MREATFGTEFAGRYMDEAAKAVLMAVDDPAKVDVALFKRALKDVLNARWDKLVEEWRELEQAPGGMRGIVNAALRAQIVELGAEAASLYLEWASGR